jgi:hypothetical protein
MRREALACRAIHFCGGRGQSNDHLDRHGEHHKGELFLTDNWPGGCARLSSEVFPIIE